MKQLYLIRHAKSSWSQPELADFDRPLNKRGIKNGPLMAGRLLDRHIVPQRIVASPAKRAKKTARYMAKGTGYKKGKIVYDKGLYAAKLTYALDVIECHFNEVDVLFIVGHNPTITALAEYLTGIRLYNVPTCGIVGVEYEDESGFVKSPRAGSLLFFDFPKKEFP